MAGIGWNWPTRGAVVKQLMHPRNQFENDDLSSCANACPEDAISFPEKSEVVELVKKLRVQYASG